MAERRNKELMTALGEVAPGRPLREGLDRILKAGMGALIVLGDGPEVLNISSGGPSEPQTSAFVRATISGRPASARP